MYLDCMQVELNENLKSFEYLRADIKTRFNSVFEMSMIKLYFIKLFHYLG